MEREALALMMEHMTAPSTEPHAVILSGGRTPIGLYEHIHRRPFKADPSLSVIVSDERYVTIESPESNFGNMREMLSAIGVADSAILRVHTELPLDQAADRYNDELTAFALGGGAISLGLLGLGEDGHVASLFSVADVRAGVGRMAIAVRRDPGPHRVSVTPALLRTAGRLIFLVAGPRKAAIVEKMRSEPEALVAGQAVEGSATEPEIWYSKSL